MRRLRAVRYLGNPHRVGWSRYSWAWAVLFAAAIAVTPSKANGQGGGTATLAGWAVMPEPERVYGWMEGVADSEFTDIIGIAYGSDGRIAVADRQLASITVFSPDGTVVATMGGRGDGPGEFRNITTLVADGADQIVAFDRVHQRTSTWTFDGKLVGSGRLEGSSTGRAIAKVGRFRDGGWYAREANQAVQAGVRDVARDTVAFHRLSDNGVVGVTLVKVPGGLTTHFIVRGMPGSRSALFSPRALGVVRGNCLVVGTSDDPVLRIVDGYGRVRSRLDLEVELRRATEGDRRHWTSEAITLAAERSRGDLDPMQIQMIEAVGAAAGMAEQIPFVNDMIVDDLGYIWGQRYQLGDGSSNAEWRIFSEAGQAVGTIRLPEGLRILSISADTIAGVWTDSFGRQYVRMHTLNRGRDIESRPLPAGCG